MKGIGWNHPRCLAFERAYTPEEPKCGDEIFCNGLFYFHISALLKWLELHPQPVVNLPVRVWGCTQNVEEKYIQQADLKRPIVVVEMAPDYRDFVPDFPENDWLSRGYVCVDGHHRIQKASRMGLDMLPAVVLRMEQHVPFMYSGYEYYVNYWNEKLAVRMADAKRWEKTAGHRSTRGTD